MRELVALSFNYDPASQITSILRQLTASATPINKAATKKRGRESFLDSSSSRWQKGGMPRRPRLAVGELPYHVLNRRVGCLPLFAQPGDCAAFETILAEAAGRTRIRLAAYCLMPNHWHVLLWPPHDGELSDVVRWITVTHTQRWHAHRKTAGTGPLYQGRFTSFPVQTNAHLLTVARYVERNTIRATLVGWAEDWRWGSVWRRTQGDPELSAWLSDWPLDRPRDWVARINRPHTAPELESLRLSVQRGRPFGAEAWVGRMSQQFGMESTVRPRGRPRGS